MPKCPKCGKEIDYLKDYFPVWQEYNMRINENGEEYYEFVNDSIPMDVMNDEFECPECGEILFKNHDDAVKFLRGE